MSGRRDRFPGLRVFPIVAALALSSCITAVQGTGPVIRPAPGEEFRGRLAIAAGGGGDSGVLQATLAGTAGFTDYFGLELGVTANGVWAGPNEALRRKQDLEMNWGLWPWIAPTFYIGPADIRVILFGIGGGGPEGPGGYMGLAGATVGWHFESGMQIYGGFTAQAVYGCCQGEYDGVHYQVPVGWVIDEFDLSGDGMWMTRLGLELVWSHNSAGTGPASEAVWDAVTILANLIFDGGE